MNSVPQHLNLVMKSDHLDVRCSLIFQRQPTTRHPSNSPLTNNTTDLLPASRVGTRHNTPHHHPHNSSSSNITRMLVMTQALRQYDPATKHPLTNSIIS